MSRTFAQDKPLRRALFLAAVWVSLVLGDPAAVWAQSYTFTTLDPPGSDATFPLAINAAGQVVGYYSVGTSDGWRNYGFLFSGGSYTTLDPPGSTRTLAYAINDAGQIVGYFYDGHWYGFIATPISKPPVITITATPETLWPPNGKLVPVTISGTITDEDSGVDEITAAYAVIDGPTEL